MESSLDDDYFDPIVFNERNGFLVSGHLRKKVLLSKGKVSADTVIVNWDDETHKARLLAANASLGENIAEGVRELLDSIVEAVPEFNFELTAFPEADLSALFGFNAPRFVSTDGAFVRDGEEDLDGEEDETYTTRISSPHYEPSGEPPAVSELTDYRRRDGLLEEIEAAEIPEEVKEFLRLGAQRHVVFDYGKIANFYAHAPAEIQELMEDSALVIVDFEKAIANGYVLLTERMRGLYGLNQERLEEERAGDEEGL